MWQNESLNNDWFFLSGYLRRLFILSVFRSPPDSRPFWSIKQFSGLPAKRYKSFTLLCIMSCIMHWQAAIKTFTILSSYSGGNPSSGVLFNFGCFLSPTFYLFSLLPRLPILSLFCFHTCFPFLSCHFSSLSLRLDAAFGLSDVLCVLPRPVRTGHGTRGGQTDDPKLSANTCWMLRLTLRPCALGGARQLCRRKD